MSKLPVPKMKKTVKKKGFFIDKISEDSFYENLLLGLTSVLKSCPFVNHIKLERLPPATVEEVVQWEANTGLFIPPDMRDFYLSTNGFSFTYKFQYDKTESEDSNSIYTGIEINPLSQMEKVLVQTTLYVCQNGVKMLATYANIYTLSKIDESSYVVIAHFNVLRPPNFWVYYKMKNFYFLCEDFTTYFRMALAHLGVPGWQLAILNATMPEWSSEMIQILAPGVFDKPVSDYTDLNKIDPEVFNMCEDAELNVEVPEEEKPPVVKKKTPKAKPKK